MYLLNTNMLINLYKTDEELWNGLKQSLRTDIRKALKSDIEVKFNIDNNEFKQCCDLYLKMMKDKLVPVDIDYHSKLSKMKVIVLLKKGKVISYMFFTDFSNIDKRKKSKISSFENTATDFQYRKLSPNSLLYRESIKYMKKLGFEYLSFTGCAYQFGDSSLNNLTAFKRRWNGIEIQTISEKTFLGYIYWRYFRRYNFVKKIVYILLINLFKNKFLKY